MGNEEKLELDLYRNITHEDEEKALVDRATGKVIFNGDYYHEKTDYKVEGFLSGLKHVGVSFVLVNHEIDASHEMFDKLGFYDGSED